MEEGQAVTSSSLVEAPILDNREAGESSPVDVSECHGNDSSKEGSWLADSDEEADEASHLDREWKRRHDAFYNAGYRDGISAGRNDAAQDGFNHGFKDSIMVGYKWGIVRGVTSALAHIPNDLKVKLVETNNIRDEFLNLHGAVDSIGAEDALKLFYEDVQSVKSVEQSPVAHQSGFGSSGLECYFGKLELLLKQSPTIDVHLELNEK